MTYARMANDLLAGEADWSHPFTFRIITVALLAVCYQLFGVGDWASALPALTASLAIAGCLALALRGKPWWVLALALAGYFGMRWNTFYSDKIMADVLVSALSFAATVAYLRHRRTNTAAVPTALLAMTCLFVAFNAKGSVVLLVPVFLWFLLQDLLRGKRLRFWVAFSVIGACWLGAYLIVCQWLFGSPLARFNVIEAHRYLNDCSYDSMPVGHLVERLTTGYWAMLVDSRMLFHVAVAVVTLVIQGLRGRLFSSGSFYPATALVVFLSMNFMTISFNSYNPVCTDPRHVLPYTPLIALCSAMSLFHLSGLLKLRGKQWLLNVAAVVIGVALLLPAYRFALYSQTLQFDKVRGRFETVLPSLPPPAVVYGTRVTHMLAPYLINFRQEEMGLRFERLDAMVPCPAGASDTTRYLVKTWYTEWHSERSNEWIDERIKEAGYRAVASELSVEGLEVYRLECVVDGAGSR